MLELSEEQRLARLRVDNPWWAPPRAIPDDLARMRPRPYLDVVWPLLLATSPRRALVLLGCRRVGKTVLLHHAIARLLAQGVEPSLIHLLSLDTPSFTGIALDDLVDLSRRASGRSDLAGACVVVDEIQYLRDWERHLKRLVDTRRDVKFIVSGSAAAALRLKSVESGAGRFTDVYLPPLTFYEYLFLLDQRDWVDAAFAPPRTAAAAEMDRLNQLFVQYLNFGGFPEIVARGDHVDVGRYVRQDIVDKVLHRDLPSLYGIDNITELNQFFNVLAFQTGQEVSLDRLSKQSGGMSKNTIKKYLEYLQAAFLVDVVHRIDRNARRFQRATVFKVFLSNPSMRAALFTPEPADGVAMGALVETGLFAQFAEQEKRATYYARWDKEAEVDFVRLSPDGRPIQAIEVKWSDRYFDDPDGLRGLAKLRAAHPELANVLVTTRTRSGVRSSRSGDISFKPAAIVAYQLGATALWGERRNSLASR